MMCLCTIYYIYIYIYIYIYMSFRDMFSGILKCPINTGFTVVEIMSHQILVVSESKQSSGFKHT